jgi:putative MATE family efflux protein
MKLSSFIGDKAFYRHLIAVSLPLILQQLVTASVQIVDNVMVGRLGETAIGAVSVVNQLFFVVIITTFGVISGSTIYMAQYYGAKNQNKLNQTYRITLYASLLIALIAFVIFSLADTQLIRIFTSNPVTIGLAEDYISIIRWGLFGFAISIAISSSLRVVGITKPLLWISVFTIVLNTVLNALLIFGLFGFPELGVIGAAIATAIARFAEAGLSLWYMWRRQNVFTWDWTRVFAIEFTLIKAIVIIGFPLLLNEIFWSVGQTTFLYAYSTRGDGALAAMNITNSISQITFVLFQALGTASAVFVGNKLGENELEEAQANAKRLVFTAGLVAAAVGLVQFMLSGVFTDFYVIDELTKSWAIFNIRVNALFVPLYTMNVTLFFIIRSGGDTKSTLLMDSGFMWLIAVPVALTLAFYTAYPITWMFLIVQGTEFLKVLFSVYRYNKKRWVKNLATETPQVVV